MGLFDFITNALTPPGTSEAQRDSSRKAKPQEVAGQLLNQFKPTLFSSLKSFQAAQPYADQARKDLFKLQNPSYVEGKVSNTRQKLLEAARLSAQAMSQNLEGTGGIGLDQGLQIQGQNQANSQANDLMTYYASPQGQAELSRMILELSTQFPELDVLSVLNSIIQGRQAPSVGPSPLNGIAQAGALFA